MPQVRLISWSPGDGREHAAAIEAAGFAVNASRLTSVAEITRFRESPPSLILIDLDRLPSHGREVAISLRQRSYTRHIPIVFAGGLPEKVERIRHELPDAHYTDWRKAPSVLKRALKNRPAEPVQPVAHMQRYAGSPLVKKLGLPKNSRVALLGAPEDFLERLGELPEGVEIARKMAAATKLAIWFVHSRQELETGIDYLSARLPEGSSVWIVYPKQTSRYKVDFKQPDVRAAGLAAGLVDYKVCAVDENWTGLKFAWKKS